ncbi:hypothetical protein ACFSOZ_18795 [Mesorhizobium newzealandense]|uniref:Uncharacterized protein n=3 Tax=Mesorhizobium TaxID=68287 RepID=A0ABW4W901_9HYPH|nr:hypothetical protein [Mesorhizobium sophorae]
MPDRHAAVASGRLSSREREKEFAALTDDEARRIEAVYAQIFGAD